MNDLLKELVIKTLVKDYETENVPPKDFPPHPFVGPYHRWCELCNLPDRNPIHDVKNIKAFQKKTKGKK